MECLGPADRDAAQAVAEEYADARERDVQTISALNAQPRQVLRLIQSVQTRWSSTYAMLQRFNKLRASVQMYHSGVPTNPGLDRDTRAKLNALELTNAEWSLLSELLVVLEEIKDIQVDLEASDVPNFMVVGRLLLKLLYTSDSLNAAMSDSASGPICEFVHKFKTKLSNAVDDPAFW